MERGRMGLGKFGARHYLIVCGGLDGAKKQEPSHRDSVFPGSCQTKAGEGVGGSNREG